MNVVFSDKALKQLRKLDVPVSKKILDFVDEVSALENPRSRGKALVGNLSGKWRYRVGDYRLVCEIEDDKILVTVLRIAHRKDVYR